MMCRVTELQYKELVDVSDGTRYGGICDLEIDTDTGLIKEIVVYGRPRALGLLGRNTDVRFPWSDVKKVGSDIILVEGHGKSRMNPSATLK